MRSCTIVCPRTDFHELLRNVRALINGDVIVVGNEEHWQSIQVTSPAGANSPTATITFNSLEFIAPDDEFSRLVRSMGNHVRHGGSPDTDLRADLAKRVYGTKWFIGIVAEPAINREFGHENCIFETAKNLEAMIFTGSGMLDAFGDVIA